MFVNKSSIFIFCIAIILSGCGFGKALTAMHTKKVKPQYYSFEDKSIIFTPLVHFGQKEFYKNLNDSIVGWKKNGYIIFYEGIIHNASEMGVDSITADNTNRKWRKIVGGEQMTREGYEELNEVFKNKMVQPENEDLGIDSTDLNADITMIDLVSHFEEYYEEVNLDSCDFATPLDSNYTCNKKLKGKLKPIILDYRNEQLVEKVIASPSDKIVVLYGAMHIKGMKKSLKQYEKGNK